jgi:hypothetical protein
MRNSILTAFLCVVVAAFAFGAEKVEKKQAFQPQFKRD